MQTYEHVYAYDCNHPECSNRVFLATPFPIDALSSMIHCTNPTCFGLMERTQGTVTAPGTYAMIFASPANNESETVMPASRTLEEKRARLEEYVGLFDKALEVLANNGINEATLRSYVDERGSTITPTEQLLNHIIVVADWLHDSVNS